MRRSGLQARPKNETPTAAIPRGRAGSRRSGAGPSGSRSRRQRHASFLDQLAGPSEQVRSAKASGHALATARHVRVAGESLPKRRSDPGGASSFMRRTFEHTGDLIDSIGKARVRTNIEFQVLTESRSDGRIRIKDVNSRVRRNGLQEERPDQLIVAREAVADHNPRSGSAEVGLRNGPCWLKIRGDSLPDDWCDDGCVTPNRRPAIMILHEFAVSYRPRH